MVSLKISSALAVAALLGQAAAQFTPLAPFYSNFSTVQGEYGCYTDYATDMVNGPVPTHSRIYSITVPVTYYDYTTPSVVTVTVTPTQTTVPPTINQGGGTITATTTITTTSRSTSTFVVTIPTSPGFLPLASAIANANRFNKRSRRGAGRVDGEVGGTLEDLSVVEPRDRTQPLLLSVNAGAAVVQDPPLTPQQVVCEQVIRVYSTTRVSYTVTGVVTTTTTAAMTAVVTGQGATVVSGAVTVPTFVTTTYTATDFVANPTYTAYDACQSNNLVAYRRPGQPFVEAANGFPVFREARFETTAYDCCVACQRASGCAGSLFFNQCFIFKVGQGDSGDVCQAPGELRYGRNPNSPAFTASNGQCASWQLSETRPGTDGTGNVGGIDDFVDF